MQYESGVMRFMYMVEFENFSPGFMCYMISHTLV